MDHGYCDNCRAISFDPDKHVRDGITRYRTPSGHDALDYGTDLRTQFEVIVDYPEMRSLRTSSASGCSFCGFLLRSFERHRHNNADIWADRLADATKFKVTATYRPSFEFGGVWFDTEDRNPSRQPHSQMMLHSLQAWIVAGEKTSTHAVVALILEFPLYVDKAGLQTGQFLRIHRRELETATMSAENIQRMRSWVEVCTENHPNCVLDDHSGSQRTVPAAPLPARLVDVGLAGSGESQRPRVVLAKDVISSSSGATKLDFKYSALSYCWGPPSSMMMITTKANLGDRLAGLAQDQTPKTFRDAFEVNRHLGLRYIWIDALCIIQDDEADWRTEAAKMGAIYRNAHVTVAAVASASTNDGFIHPRKPAGMASVKIPFRQNDMDGYFWAGYGYSDDDSGSWERGFDDDVDGTIWNQRGWTFQERFLSRRTLYFGREMIHFECLSSRKSENMAGEYGPSSTNWVELLQRGPRSSGKSSATLRKQIISRFSQRLFTYEKDRLPAFEGIAQELNRAMGAGQTKPHDAAVYVSGMWSDGLFEDLLWSRSGTLASQQRKTTTSIIPSWSWACNTGKVLWARPHNGDPLCDVMPMCTIQLVQPADGNKPLANALSGGSTIRIDGYLASLKLGKSSRQATLRQKGVDHTEYLELDDVERKVNLRFDIDLSLDDLDKVGKEGLVYLAPTCARLGTSEDCALGLVLTRVEDKTRSIDQTQRSFARVGTFELFDEFEWTGVLGDELAMFQRAGFQVV